MAAVKDRVYNVETTVKIDGSVIAVSGFSVNYNLNKVPTAQLQMALGQGYNVKRGAKTVKPSAIREGMEVSIEYFHKPINGGQIGGTIFEGIVAGITSTKASSPSGTNIGCSINCIHKLAKLGGLPTIARAYVLDESSSTIFDTYRKKVIVTPDDKSLSGMSDKKGLTDIAVSPGLYLKAALTSLYKSEQSEARANNPEAIEVLNDIGVTKMTMSGPRSALNTSLKMKLSRQLALNWMKGNGLTLLTRTLQNLYCSLIPTSTTAVMAPNFPLSKKFVGTVKAGALFAVSSRSMLSPVPVAGVRLLYSYDSNDKAKKDTQQLYAQYPPASDNVEGIYEYIKAPPWAILTKNYNLGKPPKPQQVGTRSQPQHQKGIAVKDTKNEEVPVSELQIWADDLAKSEFNTRSWAKNSFSMSVPLGFNVAPGMVIKIDVSSDETARDLFGGVKLIGQVQGVSIRSTVGSFAMQASVAYVRTEEENNQYAFDTHPIYDNYTMGRIPLY